MIKVLFPLGIIVAAIVTAKYIKFRHRKYVPKQCAGDMFDLGEDTHQVIWPKKEVKRA